MVTGMARSICEGRGDGGFADAAVIECVYRCLCCSLCAHANNASKCGRNVRRNLQCAMRLCELTHSRHAEAWPARTRQTHEMAGRICEFASVEREIK